MNDKLVYLIFLSTCSYFVNGNHLFVNIKPSENNTFIFYYNITTNSSYYITFRLFEHPQIKYGLFPSYKKENFFRISNPYNSTSSTTNVYLFIICFHFIRQINDLDIQCKDIRLLKPVQKKLPFPTYKPLFIPMMYALSVLMLLPVIIQHRRNKRANLIRRRKELRRLSLTIVQNNPTILSNIVQKTENRNLKFELQSLPSTKTTFEDIDENENITFTLENLKPFIEKYDNDDDDEDAGMTADDCVAHLLDSAPWNSTSIQELSMDTNTVNMNKLRNMPIITISCDEENDQQQPMLEHSTNSIFMESDV